MGYYRGTKYAFKILHQVSSIDVPRSSQVAEDSRFVSPSLPDERTERTPAMKSNCATFYCVQL